MRVMPVVLLSGCVFGSAPTDERTCDDVVTAYEAEKVAIQTCSVDADCGQVLTGTSCGCTQDLVANLGADTSAFYALLDEGGQLACGLGVTSVCSCPEAVGFACDAGTCVWDYTFDDPYLPQCDNDTGDSYQVDGLTLKGDDLIVAVAYGGGCDAHDFVACWPDGTFAESYPVQATLELYHDGHDDACDAWLTEDVAVSLVPLADAYEAAYQTSGGTITVHVGGFSVDYSF